MEKPERVSSEPPFAFNHDIEIIRDQGSFNIVEYKPPYNEKIRYINLEKNGKLKFSEENELDFQSLGYKVDKIKCSDIDWKLKKSEESN